LQRKLYRSTVAHFEIRGSHNNSGHPQGQCTCMYCI
jgi:hypothetical protein